MSFHRAAIKGKSHKNFPKKFLKQAFSFVKYFNKEFIRFFIK